MNPASTAPQRVTELRHSGVRLTVELLIAGQREQALAVLLRSVEQQARVSGIRCQL